MGTFLDRIRRHLERERLEYVREDDSEVERLTDALIQIARERVEADYQQALKDNREK